MPRVGFFVSGEDGASGSDSTAEERARCPEGMRRGERWLFLIRWRDVADRHDEMAGEIEKVVRDRRMSGRTFSHASGLSTLPDYVS